MSEGNLNLPINQRESALGNIVASMDFRNVNLLNVHINYISGNLLPLTPHDSEFSIVWRLYGSLMWVVQLIQICTLISGLFLMSAEKTFGQVMLLFVLTIEVFFIVGQIQTRRRSMDRLIEKLNDVLQIEDELMKKVVTTTLKPMDVPLKCYSIAGSVCGLVWYLSQILIITEKNTFVYEDFRLPAAFSKQPFSTRTFVLGSIMITIANVQIFLKECGVLVYIIHLVLMITAQYRYTAKKLATIFRDADKRYDYGKISYKEDQWLENTLKALCKHHSIVVRLSSILKEILSSSLNMLYINSVLRFCFTAVMISKVSSTDYPTMYTWMSQVFLFPLMSCSINELLSQALSTHFIDFLLVVVYSSGSVVEFYMLCSCVQQLQDASIDITDEAFHEKWYRFGPSIKRTFLLMTLGSKLGCKLTTCEKFNLSLSSFMTILNQSYSIALVLL